MKYYKINFQVKFNKKLETDKQFVPLRNRLRRKKFKEKEYIPDMEFLYQTNKSIFKSKFLKKYEVSNLRIENYKTKYCFIQGDVDCSFECNELGLDKVNLIIKWFNKVTKSECTFLGFNFKEELTDEDLEIQKIFATLEDPDFVSENEREEKNYTSRRDEENRERMRIVRSHKKTNGLTNLTSIYKRN